MLFNCGCILQLYVHSEYLFHLQDQDVRSQGETSKEGLQILPGDIQIPNRPSWNVYLPNEDGILEQVEVPRVSYGEGLPLPPHVHLAYRPHLEEAYQLISGLKHLVLVLKTEAQFQAQANRKLQAKEGYLYEQIADLKAQLRDRGIGQQQDVRSSFYRPYFPMPQETCCPGTPTPLPPHKIVSTHLEERLNEPTGTDALVRPGTLTQQPIGSPSYPSSSASQPKRPAQQRQALADYWSTFWYQLCG
ncbi:unnamed protein product, partial [Vitis vinifera]|uniref:Uncharacterized protein n=1 Tax=Vitis vinifera TaxID=29760 RepID=D7SPV1_VITVI